MSNDAKKYLDSEGLSYFWDKIKDYVGEAVESGTSDIANKIHFVAPNEKEAIQALTAAVSDVDALSPGLVVALRMPFDSVASQTLNINNLGAKPIYYRNNTTDAGVFPSGAIVLLIYETTSVGTGCFKAVYSYDGAQPSVYQGATENANGVAGLVPSALSEEKDRFLKGDGTWASANTEFDLQIENGGSETTQSDHQYTSADMGGQAAEYNDTFYLTHRAFIDNTLIVSDEGGPGNSQIDAITTIDCSSLTITSSSEVEVFIGLYPTRADDFSITYDLTASLTDLLAAGSDGLPMVEDASNAEPVMVPLTVRGSELRVSCVDNNDGTYTFTPFVRSTTTEVVEPSINLLIDNPDGTSANVAFPVYQGATDSDDGTIGLVPAASSEEKDRFLKGDGTWAEVNTEKEVGYSTTEPTSQSTASLDNESFVFYETESFGGDGAWNASISGNAATADSVNHAMTLKVDSGTLEGLTKYSFNGSVAKEVNLVAGNGVTLTPTYGTVTISTETYSSYQGATENANGVEGLVPAATSAERDKYLKGDGTWSEIANVDTSTLLLDSYQKADSASAISSSDSVLQAIGKLEKALDGKQSSLSTVTSSELSTGTDTSSKSVTAKVVHDYVTEEVASGVAGLVNSAPATLDTLNELAAALGNDANFATTVSGQIGSKLDASSANYIKSLSISGQTITYTKGDNTTGTLTTQDTISSTYQGATENANGVAGLVPAAQSGDKDKYLKGDGTWDNEVLVLSSDPTTLNAKTFNVVVTEENVSTGAIPVTTTGNQTVGGQKTFTAGIYGGSITLASNVSTFDVSQAVCFTKTITENTTLSFANVPADCVCCVSVILVNGGNYAVTWPAGVKWTDNIMPTLTKNGTDVLTFITCTGGSVWYGATACTGVTA